MRSHAHRVAPSLVRFVLTISLCASCANDGPSPSSQAFPTEPTPWPRWAWEHWVWEGNEEVSKQQSTQTGALDLVDGYLQRDIPVDAIIIDSPWATAYSTFDWDPARYPDPQGLVDAMHARGVRVMVWTVTAINTDSPNFAEADRNGYFLTRGPGEGTLVVEWWKGPGGLVDFFNPAAVEWWHSQLDNVLNLGIDGWKADGTDYSLAFGKFFSPAAGRYIERPEYSHAYYRDLYEHTRGRLGEDRIITARPIDNYGLGLGGDLVAFAPVDINFAGWVGDQDATFEGLKAALDNMYRSSEHGYLAFGSDIGGYRTDPSAPAAWGRTKELFIRWAQLGAFSPVMENGGGGEHRPWMFDEETSEIYRRFAKIHYALLDYLMAEGARAWRQGRSLMQFLSRRDFSYLLGSDLLVAPILQADGEVTVAFPTDGDWIYMFDPDERYEGGSGATLKIPLTEFPAFLREGSTLEAHFRLP
ncbi:MAG: hypothetical protein HYY13_01485 [Nitrospirae bacterium]|nr:hypothetical protein [Nitrospirota bacterium]